ncbi:MAG: ABC-type multidrug transport system, permease component [Planctomycetota bacterium]|nr:ABC-type multidrug transport system, permease component [Planctomycetota bacterium]
MSSSLRELYLARLREFYRQPARIFWVYGFPMVLAIGLGLAFKTPAQPRVFVDVVPPTNSSSPVEKLLSTKNSKPISGSGTKRVVIPGNEARPALEVRLVSTQEGDRRVKTGKSSLLVLTNDSGKVEYRYDPTRPEAMAARAAFDDALQAANGRPNPVRTRDDPVTEKGSRYIDFLIPGLIGQNTMGGGLWGVGFLLVNFRIAKLLKRFMATPMPRRNFLLAILGARLTFLVPDVGVLLALGYFGFGMPIRGNLGLVVLLEVIGALAFAGIGLLIASRAKTTETVSGLMNLVMLPMWIFSGLFFSSERFPDAIQPFVQTLPLTQLLNALRAVLLEGAGIADQVVWVALAVLSVWAVGTFYVALRIFRWT